MDYAKEPVEEKGVRKGPFLYLQPANQPTILPKTPRRSPRRGQDTEELVKLRTGQLGTFATGFNGGTSFDAGSSKT
jgi:hypothetical protein